MARLKRLEPSTSTEKEGKVDAETRVIHHGVPQNADGGIVTLEDTPKRCLIGRDQKNRQAVDWLAANRSKHVGQWIALRGDLLLATGTTAKEVYSQLGDAQPPVLVTKVESDDLPFGGW